MGGMSLPRVDAEALVVTTPGGCFWALKARGRALVGGPCFGVAGRHGAQSRHCGRGCLASATGPDLHRVRPLVGISDPRGRPMGASPSRAVVSVGPSISHQMGVFAC